MRLALYAYSNVRHHKNLCGANLCNLHLTCIIRINKSHAEICHFRVVDSLSCSKSSGPWHPKLILFQHPPTHACKLDLLSTKRLAHLQSLGVAASTRRTYQAGINSYLTFYAKHGIKLLPASQLTLQYFVQN